MRIALTLLCAVLTAPVLAQDHAKPRDRQTKPQSEQTDRRRPRPGRNPQARPPNRRPDQPAETVRPERRHPQPQPGPAPPARFPHPQLGPRQRHEWHWRNWQDWGRWPLRHRTDDRFWFPFSYPHYPRSHPYFDVRLFGFRFGPHFHAQGRRGGAWVWFYWPFRDPPSPGCGWYWVPTKRIRVRHAISRWRWVYWDWKSFYLCVN